MRLKQIGLLKRFILQIVVILLLPLLLEIKFRVLETVPSYFLSHLFATEVWINR